MMNRCLDIEKDFSEDCKVYDFNLRDYFGNKFYVVYNELFETVRFYSKDKMYNKRRKELDKKNLQHVIIQKYVEVIDIRKETYNQIQRFLPSAKLPCMELLNIW
jgi:hypothetical protein